MSALDVLLLLVIAAAFVRALIFLRRARKNGKCACCGSCNACCHKGCAHAREKRADVG